MTAACGGGASQPRPGVEPLITIGSVGVGAIVTALGFPELDFVIGLAAGGASFETEVFCAVDPPADPILTTDDIANALDFTNALVQIPALARCKQWFESQYWNTI